MNIELKPCPFCGGEAVARVSPNSRSEEGASFYEVRCKKCGVHVTGKSFNFWVVKYNKEKPQDLLSAVEEWNKRAYEENGRKTGKWIRNTNGRGGHECNQCNEYAPSTRCGTERLSPYCPNCGVKMEVDG